MNDIVIVSYPRSGSTFLKYYYELRFQKQIHRDHIYKKKIGYNVVGIVREPASAIASYLAMQELFYEDYRASEDLADICIKEYIKAASFLRSKASLVFEYNFLINNPESAIEIISKQFGHDVVFDGEYNTKMMRNDDASFVPSSKVVERYEEILELVLGMDLSECLAEYNLLIEKESTWTIS